MIDLSAYINSYYKQWSWINDREFYKWAAFKHYREHNIKEYRSIYERVSTVYSKAKNLLDSGQYYPLGVLHDMSCDEGRPSELKSLFEELLQEGVLPTKDRVKRFITGTDNILKCMAEDGYSDWKGRQNLHTYQDVRAISVYLSMFYPDDFYLYKYGVFVDFAKKAQFNNIQKGAVERMFEYQEMCKEVKWQLLKHRELIDFYENWLNAHGFQDDNYNLLTQDFIYAVARHMNSDTFFQIEKKAARVGKYKEVSAGHLKSPETALKTSVHTVSKGKDYKKIEQQNNEIGFNGELWVMNFEKERLKKLGISPDKVRHTSHDDGEGLGYDILSVEDDGSTPRYIEVKTTSGNEDQSIFFSDNELNFSMEHKEHYYLYRVYNFKAANKPANLTVIHDSLDSLKGTPMLYRAVIKY